MRPTKYNPFRPFLAMTIWFFCSTSLVVAAGPNPPQSLSNMLTSPASPAELDGVHQSESGTGLFAAYLMPARYVVIDVPPIDGHNFTKGYGINNYSQVVGRSYNLNPANQEAVDVTALYWDLRTGSTALTTLDGESGAWGLNDTGTATGFSTSAAGHQRAVRWALADGTITDLGTLTNPDTLLAGDESYAYGGINDANTIVGHAEIPNAAGDFTPYHGFIYDAANGMRDLGTLSSDTTYMGGYSIAYDINAANTVVGIANIDSWAFRPFVWTEATGMTELSIDEQRTSGEWYATVISASGLIGGYVIDGEGRYPYFWPTQEDSPVAAVMPAAYPYGEIYGQNQPGQMVGGMYNAADEDHAFIFDPENGILDLNNLISSGSGWVLETAVDINDMGQVAGIGTLNGGKRAFLLTPTADADDDADIDGSDMARLIQEFGQTACSEACSCDYNGDDAVNGVDVALLAMVIGGTH